MFTHNGMATSTWPWHPVTHRIVSVSEGLSDGAGVFDGSAHDFGHCLLDHHFLAGVAADDGVGGGFDVTDFFGVDDETLAIQSREHDHGQLRCVIDRLPADRGDPLASHRGLPLDLV